MFVPSPRCLHVLLADLCPGRYSHQGTQYLVRISSAPSFGGPNRRMVFRFFDDIELLRQRWQSANTDSIGQLYVPFFTTIGDDPSS